MLSRTRTRSNSTKEGSYVVITPTHDQTPFDQLCEECESLLRGLGYAPYVPSLDAVDPGSKPSLHRRWRRQAAKNPRVVTFWPSERDTRFEVGIDRQEYGSWLLTDDAGETYRPRLFLENFLKRVATRVFFRDGLGGRQDHYVPPDYAEDEIRASVASRLGEGFIGARDIYTEDSTGRYTVYS